GSRKLFNKHSAKIGESYNTNYIALRMSGQQSSSRRSTCNDEVLLDINDVSCKDSTVATLLDFSDVDPVTRREFKTSALNGFEYFTYLEMARKIKSQMTLKTAIAGNSTDFSISTKVNSLMVDATNMDEKFAMIEQTIEALKKYIDDKNIQITQLMSKLDLYNFGESHHILTIQEKVDIDSPTKPIDSQSANRSVLRLVASLKIEEDVIILQFGSFEPVEVFVLKKTTNTSKVDDFSNKKNDDTWILVARKRQKYQGTSKLRLSKVDTKSSTNQLQQCESIRSNTKLKYINASSQKLAHEFKCVTNEQRRRVKQDILADFKGTFVKIHKDMTFKRIKKTLQQAFCKDWRKLQHQLHNSSKEWSTEFFPETTYKDKVLLDVPEDKIHLKEVYIILHSRNTLLNALESWRNLGEKNQENNKILIFSAYENLLRTYIF
ncbi:hypothetical protein H5410_024549, partial [Solanum commersonii]